MMYQATKAIKDALKQEPNQNQLSSDWLALYEINRKNVKTK